MSDPHKRNPVHLSVETMAHDKSKPEILKAEIVAESRLFKVESLHLKFSNGEERVYERMRGGNRGAVMVVPCSMPTPCCWCASTRRAPTPTSWVSPRD